MRREFAVMAVALLVASTSCAREGGTTVPVVASPGTLLSASTLVMADPVTTAAPPPSAAPRTLAAGEGGVVAVSGGALPRAVAAAYAEAGGELAEASSWAARFGTSGLPLLSGDGVVLVSARVDAVRVAGGWRRTDELQWLLRDDTQTGLEGLLDEVAEAAGVAGRGRADEVSVVQGASCTTRTYRLPGSGESPVWRVHGCSYPTEPGMFAVGVGCDGVFANVGPPLVEPSTVAVVDAMGGRVDAVSVVFDRPAVVGSVTTLTTRVTVGFDGLSVESATAVLADGALTGWRALAGEGSVLFAGAPGQSWVLGDATVEFTGEGRLEP